MIPTVPARQRRNVLSIIGGIGGSITMLSYNYWMREERISAPADLRLRSRRRRDRLRVHRHLRHVGHGDREPGVYVAGVAITDAQAVTKMAEVLGTLLGPFGAMLLRMGFWAAVFASLLGVWQSIPYLFADFYGVLKGRRWTRGGRSRK